MNLRMLLIVLALAVGCTTQGQTTQPLAPQESGGVRTETFVAALEDTTTAKVTLDVPFQEVIIRPLEESDNLIEAEVEYIGEVTFTADRGAVLLRERIGDATYTGEKPLRWNIRLNPDVDVVLEIEVDSGNVSLDASGLRITTLTLDTESGEINAQLPASPASVNVEVTAGEINVRIPDGADVDVTRVQVGSGSAALNIGADADVRVESIAVESGRVRVDVPPETAVRLDVQDVAAGMVNIAYSMTRLDGTGSDEGLWETGGYAAAEHHVSLVVSSIGSGTFELE